MRLKPSDSDAFPRGENYHLSGHSGAIAMGIIPFTHIIIPI
jgi:hypothetical protein